MASNNEFFELYRHPEWQRKRLEIMKLAGFKCEECGESEKTLNVHHRHYHKGNKPWEYDNRTLVCLCNDCHTSIHEFLRLIRSYVGYFGESSLQILLAKIAFSVVTEHDSRLFGCSIPAPKGLCLRTLADEAGVKCHVCLDEDELIDLIRVTDGFSFISQKDMKEFVDKSNRLCGGYHTHSKIAEIVPA